MNKEILNRIIEFPEYARKEIRLIAKQFQITDVTFYHDRSLIQRCIPPSKYVFKYKHLDSSKTYERTFYIYPKIKHNNENNNLNINPFRVTDV